MTTITSRRRDRLIEGNRLIEQIPATAGDQHRRAIARDPEALRNTAVAITTEQLPSNPACRDAIVRFGLVDFARRCPTGSDDCKTICEQRTSAIARHDRHLAPAQARRVEQRGRVNWRSCILQGQVRAVS